MTAASSQHSNASRLVIGLMSGTSADGVDAALIRTDGADEFEFIDALTVNYDTNFRTKLIQTARGRNETDDPLANVLELERQLTDVHIEACHQLRRRYPGRPIELIGFHGHTLRHDPSRNFTRQIGDAARLSQACRIPVVSDFRRMDMAAGGQGAPLAPLFHQLLLHDTEKPAVVLNLGGVANVTWLGRNDAILAGDTGPGCGLLDAWMQQRLGLPFDKDGVVAAAGSVHMDIVRTALQSPFFQLPMPKSADRFQFSVPSLDTLDTANGAATLCALTVGAVVQALGNVPATPQSVTVTGGGASHPVIMRMLAEHFANVSTAEATGLRGDSMEAECFAWLAVRRLRGLPTSLPETTGCRVPTCGGLLTGVL